MNGPADAGASAQDAEARESPARPPQNGDDVADAGVGPSGQYGPSGRAPSASDRAGASRRSGGRSRRGSLRGRSSLGPSWRGLIAVLGKGAEGAIKEARWQTLHLPDIQIPPWLRPHVTFYRVHATCYIIFITFASLVLYLSPAGPLGPYSYIDALYLAASGCCAVGLTPLYVQQLTTFELVFLMFCMMVGSQVFTSLMPVFVRRYYFHKYLVREGIRELESIAEASLAGAALEERMREVEDELGDLGSLELDTSARSFTAFRRTDDTWRKPNGAASQDNASSTTDERQTFDSDSRVMSRGFISDGAPDTPRTASMRRGQISPAIADEELLPLPDDGGGAKRVRSIAKLPGVGDGPGEFSALGRVQLSPVQGGIFRSASMSRGVAYGAHQGNGEGVNGVTPQLGRMPSNVFAFGMDQETMQDRSNQTWSGETAQLNARRLKALLEAAKQLDSNQLGTPQLNRLESTLSATGDDRASVEAQPLLPGERRFNELRALRLLSWLVPAYMFGSIFVAFIGLYLTVRFWGYYMDILDANGTNPVFLAAFQAAAGFTNSGFSLFNDNLMSFQQNVPYLCIVMCLILLGNTMYAPTLRFVIILMNRFGTEDIKEVTRYLLDHPRKCFTHLFPPKDTLWLVISVILFNSTEFIAFCALDWTSPALDGLNTGTKLLDGLFQSVATRNSGFNVIALALLTGAMQVLYVGMMYVAVYPVYVTRQRSREQREVYDDEDIGVFYEDLEYGVLDKSVLAQGKRLIGRDSVTLFIAIFIICIIQRQEIEDDPVNFSIFNIVFEVVSAYGNVGMSLGFSCPANAPNCVSPPYSFSGVWRTGGKIMLVLIMFLGRHRGLPDNIDAAIVIPGEKQFRKVMPASQHGDATLLVRQMSSAVR